MAGERVIVYTLGHSSRSAEEFAELVRSSGVRVVVDVRRWATSRRHPWFSSESLSRLLRSLGVGYEWIPSLGGYRSFGRDVEDLGIARCFSSEGFRAYATYITRSGEARSGLERLWRIASGAAAAVMCSEALPWRCHRKIISDWLTARGARVIHILSQGRLREHRLSRCAYIEGGELAYK